MKNHTKRILFFSFSAFLGGLFAGEPAETVTAPVPMEKSIMPRVEGASWTFASYWYEEGEKHLAGTVIEEVVKVIQLEGMTCYKIKNTFDYRTLTERLTGKKLTEDDYNHYWEYFNSKGSYHFAKWSDNKLQTPKKLTEFDLTLPYPVEKGYSYKFEGEEWTVLDIAKTLEVPAGSFECIVYQSVYKSENEDDWSRDRFYMAPGVGLVCLEIDFRENGKWVLDTRDELMKYHFPELPQTEKTSE